VVNALCDALEVTDLPMPLTSGSVWAVLDRRTV